MEAIQPEGLPTPSAPYGDVIKVTAFLTDMSNFAAYNEVYAATFEAPYPARTTVQAGLAPGLLVEIEALARRTG